MLTVDPGTQGNTISEKPPQYGDWAEDPITGLQVPKDPALNLQWRQDLRKQALSSKDVKRDLYAACAESPLFWINAFCFTCLSKKIDLTTGVEHPVYGDDAHYPFITWAVQDHFILEARDAIENGYDLLACKSRDMGATWLLVALFHHYWQFKPRTSFLEMSRKETLVDRRGDMDSLFEKHRYLLRWQPKWLRPKEVRDSLCMLENRDIGSTITGESTNASAGQASRCTAIMLDEYARMANAESIDLSTSDTTACRIFNSTHQGPQTYFAQKLREGKTKTVLMPWIAHPDKGDKSELIKSDKSQWWAPPDMRWVSPWYRQQEQDRTPRDLAANVDMDPGDSGDRFFDSVKINNLLKVSREPKYTGRIEWIDDHTEQAKRTILQRRDTQHLAWLPGGTQRLWRLWVELMDGRPRQDRAYVFGVDVAAGTGASNSVITVLEWETKKVVGKFWDAFISPEELAEEVMKAGAWWGGRLVRPVLVHEHAGPGLIFANKIVSWRYAPIYQQKTDNQRVKVRTKRIGWHPSAARKEQLLGNYREQLETGRVENPCAQGLEECLDYIYDDKGRLQPAQLLRELGGGQSLHGDHVIADALAVLGAEDISAGRAKSMTAPKHSLAWYFQKKGERGDEWRK